MYAVELSFSGRETEIDRELSRAAETIGFPVQHITTSGPLTAVVFLTAADRAEAETTTHLLGVAVLAQVPGLLTYRFTIWPSQ
ncbi:hypothetical protein AB0M02_20425 [Actinoplanes sp. NPDC051861]|uniref:hypothetical protein n=1 Tax=Actinoplanes sp. NPDC051861 TaxID=3155170 RepID=UPI003449D33F